MTFKRWRLCTLLFCLPSSAIEHIINQLFFALYYSISTLATYFRSLGLPNLNSMNVLLNFSVATSNSSLSNSTFISQACAPMLSDSSALQNFATAPITSQSQSNSFGFPILESIPMSSKKSVGGFFFRSEDAKQRTIQACRNCRSSKVKVRILDFVIFVVHCLIVLPFLVFGKQAFLWSM